MTEYITDEEQVERIKKWWSENGSSIVIGLVIGIGAIGGWRFYSDYKEQQSADASVHFSQMMSALDSKQSAQVIDKANVLLEEYGATPYSALAYLSLARTHVENGDYAAAAQQLQGLLDSSPEPALQLVARKRLAAVQMQQGEHAAALATLNTDYPVEFTAAFEELKGDILVAQGNPAAAAEAYRKAQLANPPSPNPEFLQQKLDDLGLSGVNS